MRVSIKKEVLNSAAEFIHLDSIVRLFGSGRHLWDIQEQDLDFLLESTWVKNNQHAGEIIDSINKTFTYDIYPENKPENKFHTKQIFITISAQSKTEFVPRDAADYLHKPAYVMVENSSSDGDFLDAMIEAFHRKDLKEAQKDGWWEYRHIGGYGELEKQIEQLRKNLKGKLLRLVVIADSDKHHAEENTSTMKKVKECCEGKDIKCWILMKRKIENYLPIERFPEDLFSYKENFLQAFKSLTREQRDFYELKNGFKKDSKGHAMIPEDQQKLFEHLSQETRDALCDSLGKGKKTSEYFKTHRAHITREAMIAVCSPDGNPTVYDYNPDPNEIQKILDLIEAQI